MVCMLYINITKTVKKIFQVEPTDQQAKQANQIQKYIYQKLKTKNKTEQKTTALP